MMNEQDHYEKIDMPFYRSEIAPVLPPDVLDFHAHLWTCDQWRDERGEAGSISPVETSNSIGVSGSAGYMATETHYPAEQLLRHGRTIFPDRQYHAVCFGQPTPAVDRALTNAYAMDSSSHTGLYPLCVAGRGDCAVYDLREKMESSAFFGYKVYLGWIGNDYGNIRVEDMIGPDEMKLADELGLVVLLHVPRSDRLVNPEVQKDVRDLAQYYPNARIVLAHCGRCYLPSEIGAAIKSISGLQNVYLDTAMVMDPMVLRIIFDSIDSRRVLFATDFPVAAMRGRRVYVKDHWVDLVLEGYPESSYRVASSNMEATFMAYEIVHAIRLAGEQAGLRHAEVQGVFYENGIELLGHVMQGRRLDEIRESWISNGIDQCSAGLHTAAMSKLH